MIETRLLVYFLTIAQEETISKAADTLHITVHLIQADEGLRRSTG